MNLPVFAIGGINARNVRAVLAGGADGVCVARGIYTIQAILREIDLGVQNRSAEKRKK